MNNTPSRLVVALLVGWGMASGCNAVIGLDGYDFGGAAGYWSTGGAAGSAGSGGTGGAGTLCAQRCSVTSSLACSGDEDCVQDCQSAIDYAPWCSSVTIEFVTCAANQPPSSWSCDTTGHSSLKAGICEAERAANELCLVNGPAQGMPDLSAECAATCASMAGLSCVPVSCRQTCNDSVANGPCAGAVGLLTVCAVGLTAVDYDCSQGTPLPKKGSGCDDQVDLLVACLQGQ